MGRLKSLTVRISEQQHEWLNSTAKYMDRNMSWLIRKMIDKEIKIEEEKERAG